MRILLAALLALLPLTANAALVWGESSQHGYPLTHWVRGSSVTEATNLLRAHAGKNAQTILSCRQPGWFAYVGSDRDFRRGVSCGYETRAAALYKARVECEHEGCSC